MLRRPHQILPDARAAAEVVVYEKSLVVVLEIHGGMW